VVGVDPGGRVRLPPPARRALGAETGSVIARAAARGAVLVVQESGDGAGVQVAVDGRGRMSLQEWWRRACAGGACAVATRAGTGEAVGDAAGEGALVVLAPTGVLDGLADVLVGERW